MTDLTFGFDFSLATCRICLQNNGDENMTPIFEPPANCDLPFSEKIEKCVGIQIEQHEKLSSSICRNCIAFLNIAYRFRCICWNTQIYLQEYIVKHEDSVETVTNANQEQQEQTRNSHQPPPQECIVDEIQNSTDHIDSAKLQNVENKEESLSSFTHSAEEMPEDYYDECWLDGEKMTNTVAAKTKTAAKIHVVKEINDQANINSYKQDTNATSKTLGISSDGAAVIEEKSLSPVSKRSRKEKSTHICEICGNIYDRRYALVAHMRRHRDEKPYECEICGQAFHCNFELSRHIRKHTGLKPFICEYCKRAFGDRSTLLKHERIHRNERPYACMTCGKSFTYSSVLKVHQLTHTGEKPYNCDLCGKRFSRSHHLRAHLETLLHQNDPQSKILLKRIKRAEEGYNLGTEIFSTV